MPMPPQGKSILMTPDPYHIPGYGGFCPQFKYQIGDTFGRTTSRLLTDPNCASSKNLVLAEMYAARKPNITTSLGDKEAIVKARTRSWGDQKLAESMVPGYTGFIPKSQHFFGKRYAENCVNAISDFETDQLTHREKMATLARAKTLGSEALLPSRRLGASAPLKPIARSPKPYISPNTHHHSMSPYYMTNDNTQKNFMSGYTGFVPRSRGLIGRGYPIITHFALNEFTDDIGKHKHVASAPVQVHRAEVFKLDSTKIYPTENGLVPHYTGHIPGQKFRYGQTFGHSTQDSLVRSNTTSQIPISV
ncbi:ciliary microtubule inner protein 2B-like [Tubulanus polymorphus]|uniref:ciliary microtubule inner protein 2B-like n=1 Tax=Tubulanus polymorphus TaxID=672921 RepID=UPI003DA3EDCA